MKDITSSEFETEVIRSDVPVLVDFYTVDCPPCRLMAPILEEVEQESKGSIKVVKIDATQDPAFSAAHHIAAVPTLFLFKGGQRVAQATGAKFKKELRKWISELVNVTL